MCPSVPARRRRYYTPAEVALHSTEDDCWVSFLGGVYDLTYLLQDHQGGPLAQPIVDAAGTDISHWFDEKTGDIKTRIDPETNLRRPYCPQGRFIHVPPLEPVLDWDTSIERPWWKDHDHYRVGALTAGTRLVRVKNVLTEQEEVLEVPKEEKLVEIRERYLELNSHAKSYIWRALRPGVGSKPAAFQELNMNLTLEENGIMDDLEKFEDVGAPNDEYSPVLHLYFSDDLTVA